MSMAATVNTVSNLKRAEQLRRDAGEDVAPSAADIATKLKNELDEAKEQAEAEAYEAAGPLKRAYIKTMGFVSSTAIQTLLYLAFVVIFQSLSNCVRIPEEFYIDKHVMDRLVENHFDSSHNTFETVRRIADIYEWGNNVLLPGLFSDQGPCNQYVGEPGGMGAKGCNDDAWPDGKGSFQAENPTPFGLQELVERMDQFDWTEGLYIRQQRVKPEACSSTKQMGPCLPELKYGAGSRESFGHNWTHPTQPMSHGWSHFSAAELGANPDGQTSAAIPSMRL